MGSKKLKLIGVSSRNYEKIKDRGRMGDSFDDVLTEILEKIEQLQSDSQVGTWEQIATSHEPACKGGTQL